MKDKRILLTVDAVVNLVLGAVLVLAPAGVIEFFGLPATGNYFYTSVLGAVLVGIGLALLLSLGSWSGLGLMGAVTINLCGATAVVGWMLFNSSVLGLRGKVVLWTVAAVVYAIAVFELRTMPWQSKAGAG
jgi:hypothetical protein